MGDSPKKAREGGVNTPAGNIERTEMFARQANLLVRRPAPVGQAPPPVVDTLGLKTVVACAGAAEDLSQVGNVDDVPVDSDLWVKVDFAVPSGKCPCRPMAVAPPDRRSDCSTPRRPKRV